jgi:AcrR family transcriptional regulator
MFNASFNDISMNNVQGFLERRSQATKTMPRDLRREPPKDGTKDPTKDLPKAAERREQLRTALIDAAEAIIAKDGLTALRARDLATAAGCALGAIYNAFDDLDAIVFAVNMRTLALLDRHLGEAARRKPAAGAKPDAADLARLVGLAAAYLDFAARHGPRWRALFEHRPQDGQITPSWYLEEQNRIFQLVEEPLRAIRPDLAAGELAQLARTVFSAVHGVVSLGLEQKLGEIPARRLREQTAALVAAIARGLREDASS